MRRTVDRRWKDKKDVLDNFSGKELKKMFDPHIDSEAKVTTDIWRGYWPLSKEYDIELNFRALHDYDTPDKIMDKNDLRMG